MTVPAAPGGNVPDNEPPVIPHLATRQRPAIGYQAVLGAGGLLALLAVSVVIAIVLISDLVNRENRLTQNDAPFTQAVADAALYAKGVANDQRGFLMSGDASYIDEANERIAEARSAFARARLSAAAGAQRDSVDLAGSGFEQWVAAVQDEFRTFQAGDRQSAVNASLESDRALRKVYEQALAQAQALGDDSIEAATNSLSIDASRSVHILWAWLALALALGGAVAYWLVRSVAMPLLRLVTLLTPDLAA
jgi:methyl-accepting chemotaxis protein